MHFEIVGLVGLAICNFLPKKSVRFSLNLVSFCLLILLAEAQYFSQTFFSSIMIKCLHHHWQLCVILDYGTYIQILVDMRLFPGIYVSAL